MTERALTDAEIRSQTGFRLAVVFPAWQSDPAGIIEFHEELDRLEKLLGTTSVIGSLFQCEDGLALGVFTNSAEIVAGEVVDHELSSPPRIIGNQDQTSSQ